MVMGGDTALRTQVPEVVAHHGRGVEVILMLLQGALLTLLNSPQ